MKKLFIIFSLIFVILSSKSFAERYIKAQVFITNNEITDEYKDLYKKNLQQMLSELSKNYFTYVRQFEKDSGMTVEDTFVIRHSVIDIADFSENVVALQKLSCKGAGDFYKVVFSETSGKQIDLYEGDNRTKAFQAFNTKINSFDKKYELYSETFSEK